MKMNQEEEENKRSMMKKRKIIILEILGRMGRMVEYRRQFRAFQRGLSREVKGMGSRVGAMGRGFGKGWFLQVQLFVTFLPPQVSLSSNLPLQFSTKYISFCAPLQSCTHFVFFVLFLVSIPELSTTPPSITLALSLSKLCFPYSFPSDYSRRCKKTPIFTLYIRSLTRARPFALLVRSDQVKERSQVRKERELWIVMTRFERNWGLGGFLLKKMET